MIHLDSMTALNVATGSTRRIRSCAGEVGFNTSPLETPPNAIWDPATEEPMHFVRSMFGGTGAGAIDILNTDGWLDAYCDPKAWSFSGQPYEVFSGWPGQPIADFLPSFTGVMVTPEFSREKITFNCRDMQELLNKALPIPKYLGNNSGPSGTEGGEDLAGKPRLTAFGPCSNITPRCVNGSTQTYSVHFRSVQAITAVKANGAGLTFDGDDATVAALLAAVIPHGHYRTCKAYGLFRINTDQNQKISCDVQGDNVGGYVDTTAGIARRIFEIMADPLLAWSQEDLDALEAKNPAVVCLFDDSGAKGRALLDGLFEGIWGWYCPDRLGVHRFGRVEAPAETVLGNWHDDQSMEADQLASDGITGQPFGLLACQWGRNWTPMRDQEVAAVVSPEMRSWLAEEYRSVTSTADGQPDPAVLEKWPYAPSETFRSLFVNKADAEAEVARRVALRAAGLRPFRVRRAWDSVRSLELGQTYGLHSGRLLLDGVHVVVSRIEEILSVNEAEISCYG